jgi:signal transduction histidine kinase
MKLRTKFLLASLVISLGLTTACLLLVRKVIGEQARAKVRSDLTNSILTFKNVQRQRESARVRSARLLADLPIVRALMTTHDARTIQDSSEQLALLGEADLFSMSDAEGQIMALHTNATHFGSDSAAEQLLHSLRSGSRTNWWFGSGRLYEVSTQPIYFGSAEQGRLLGYLALGYELDDQLVRELSQVAESDVAVFYGKKLVRSTLAPQERTDLTLSNDVILGRSELILNSDHFMTESIDLTVGSGEHVRLTVLKSLDKATTALRNLNRLLMVTGVIAVTAGAILVFFISYTFTKPLRSLVEGVRALGRGDFEFPVPGAGQDEVAEVTAAFNRMRSSLQSTQHRLLEAEKLATIGRMASSISHDLRHHLVAIQANAEYLSDGRRDGNERELLYAEVREGVADMNDLLESLLEFSRTRASLRTVVGDIREVLERAIQRSRLQPSYHDFPVVLEMVGPSKGVFDSKKLERVFHNLLINAFAAVESKESPIRITATRRDSVMEIRVADRGPGIPISIQERLFEPFFSFGKENGTGLGLSVAQKIVQDHGGEVRLENSSPAGSVFLVVLPMNGHEQVSEEARTDSYDKQSS